MRPYTFAALVCAGAAALWVCAVLWSWPTVATTAPMGAVMGGLAAFFYIQGRKPSRKRDKV
jgi:hypothetical protein